MARSPQDIVSDIAAKAAYQNLVSKYGEQGARDIMKIDVARHAGGEFSNADIIQEVDRVFDSFSNADMSDDEFLENLLS